MTAMVGPVGVQHADLGHGRISVFLASEIVLNVLEIPEGHGQIQGVVKFPEGGLVHLAEAVEDLHVCRLLKYSYQSIRLLHRRFSGIHRVDTVALNGCQLFRGNAALNHVGGGGTDHRLLVLLQETDALYGGIRSLIKLSRQVLYAEHLSVRSSLEALFI